MTRSHLMSRTAVLALMTMWSASAAAQTMSGIPGPTRSNDAPSATGTPVDAAVPAESTQDAGLQDIVVTAQKRAENLQSVPLAITVNSAEDLAAKGINSTIELAAVTPSLTYTSGTGFATPRIRGVGSSSTLGGNENSVATYIDGVYIASAPSSLLALNNIAQVAVLKGPQGTLFGRNATGGLIQITTLDPSEDFGGALSGTLANRSTYGGGLYVTGGLSAGISADLALYYMDQQDGFGVNQFNGQDVNKSRDFSARSKFKVESGDTIARIALDYSRSRSAQPAFRAVDGSLPITGARFDGRKFDINNDRQPLIENEQGGASLTLEHDLGGPRLVSITAYRRSRFDAQIDNDKLPVVLTETAPVQPDRQFSQELQLLSDDGGAFQWVVGGYYFYGSSRFTSPVTLATLVSTSSALQRARSGAAFGQATMRLNDTTNVTGGLRYTAEKRLFDATSFIRTNTGAMITNPAVSGETSVGRVTWRVALDHRFGDRVLGYLSYNRGFKSGGFNPTRAVQPLLPFSPERLDAFEAGLKSDLFDRRIRLNASAFYYDYANIQLSAVNNAIVTIYNAASAKIYGVDFDAQFKPTRSLTVSLGVSALHDRFGDFPGATISIPRATGGNIITTGNARGNRLPNTPDWTVNVGADYAVDVGRDRLVLSATWFHSDGWAAEADNRLRQPAYDLVNASALFSFGEDRRFDIRLWGRNLTNEAYAVQINSSAFVDGVNVAAGRTFGVTGGVHF